MLSFVHRFHGHGSLRYVYKNGTAVRTHKLTLKYVRNKQRRHSRFAVVVSKKVLKSAVGRNRIRRRLYEIIRLELPHLRPAHDVVLLVFASEVRSMPHDELREAVQAVFSEAGLYAEPPKNAIITGS